MKRLTNTRLIDLWLSSQWALAAVFLLSSYNTCACCNTLGEPGVDLAGWAIPLLQQAARCWRGLWRW